MLAYSLPPCCCSYLQGGPLPEAVAAHFLWSVMDVLRECHSHNMIFGDVKPANFVLKAAYTPATDPAPPPHTHMHHTAGLPPYQLGSKLAGSSGSSGSSSSGGSSGSSTSVTTTSPASSSSEWPAVAAPLPGLLAIDFGCSLRMPAVSSGPGSSRSLKLCGSPLYLAPEAWASGLGVGVDVWAAGVLLYHMLTGKYPFWCARYCCMNCLGRDTSHHHH